MNHEINLCVSVTLEGDHLFFDDIIRRVFPPHYACGHNLQPEGAHQLFLWCGYELIRTRYLDEGRPDGQKFYFGDRVKRFFRTPDGGLPYSRSQMCDRIDEWCHGPGRAIALPEEARN